MARTATVSDWVPALPPMEATMGISTARATRPAMTSSNSAMTSEATRNTAIHSQPISTPMMIVSDSEFQGDAIRKAKTCPRLAPRS